MRTTLLMLGLGAVCLLAATQTTFSQAPVPTAAPAAFTPTVANVPMPALTAEEQKALARAAAASLDRSRRDVAILAQRAVRDREDGLFREPTAAEASALASTVATGDTPEIPVPVGGYAVRTDVSGLSFAVVTRDKDGVVTGHDAKGGPRVR